MIVKVDKQGFDEALQTNGIPIVVEFSTTWCPYCKRLAPIVEQIAAEQKDTIKVYYVDTDEEPELAEQYDIMTVPSVFVFLNGEIKNSSVNPRTKEAVLELIFSEES